MKHFSMKIETDISNHLYNIHYRGHLFTIDFRYYNDELLEELKLYIDMFERNKKLKQLGI